MLFDLTADPHEQSDRAPEDAAACAEGAARLLRWHDAMMASMPDGATGDPLRTVLAEGGPLHARGMLAEYCRRLEATERAWAVPELRRRHPQEP